MSVPQYTRDLGSQYPLINNFELACAQHPRKALREHVLKKQLPFNPVLGLPLPLRGIAQTLQYARERGFLRPVGQSMFEQTPTILKEKICTYLDPNTLVRLMRANSHMPHLKNAALTGRSDMLAQFLHATNREFSRIHPHDRERLHEIGGTLQSLELTPPVQEDTQLTNEVLKVASIEKQAFKKETQKLRKEQENHLTEFLGSCTKTKKIIIPREIIFRNIKAIISQVITLQHLEALSINIDFRAETPAKSIAVLATFLPHLKELSLPEMNILPDDEKIEFSRFKKLQTLEIGLIALDTPADLQEMVFSEIKKLPHLQALKFTTYDLDQHHEAYQEFMDALSTITELDMSGEDAENFCRNIPTHPKLQKLTLQKIAFSLETFEGLIDKLPSLTHLTFISSGISQDILSHLSRFQSLTHVTCIRCPEITRFGAQVMRQSSHIPSTLTIQVVDDDDSAAFENAADHELSSESASASDEASQSDSLSDSDVNRTESQQLGLSADF